MKVGIYIAPTDDPELFAAAAAAVDARGFDSVFLPEHTHVPVARQADRPGGDAMPHDTFRGGDPLIHLAAAAATTEQVFLGTGTLLLTQRDPIVLAKAIASLDRLAGGRLVLGLGAGWNRKEAANHGVDAARRWDVFDEKLAALKAIWRDEPAEFHGEFVDFDPLVQFPKPVQQPHPPLLISANGPAAIRRAVRDADGWQPILLPGAAPFDVTARMERLRSEAAAAGVDPPPTTLFVFDAPPDHDRIGGFARAGVDRCVFRVVPGPGPEVAPALDTLASFADSYR